MALTKYYVFNHRTRELLGQHLTRKDAMAIVKKSGDVKHVRMYPETFSR